MKKLSLLLVVAIFSVSLMQAQTPFKKGDKVVNVGIGFGSLGGLVGLSMPPISASFDYGVKDELFDAKSSLSVGGYASYFGYKSSYTYSGGEYGWKYTNIILGGRAAVHYDFVKKLDTYGGLMLGYHISSSSSYGTHEYGTAEASYGGLIYKGFLGGRYYFSESIGAFLELGYGGYGLSALEVGVAFKL